MPRGPRPKVNYWKSRSAYGCSIGGTQHTLASGPDDYPDGPTYAAALLQFSKLAGLEAHKGTDDYLVSSLLNQYRTHLDATRKSAAPGIFDAMAQGFSAKFGEKPVRDLNPLDVERWLMSQDRWNPTSKAHAGRLILSAVAWARKKQLIATDPLAKRVDLPRPVLRGREARMSDELCDLLIAEARANKMRSQEFADLMWALRLTGARPGELAHAEAHNYAKGRLVFRWNTTRGYVHKTAKSSQRDRIIYLTPELAAHVEGLARLHPAGPLFRTPRGALWTLQSLCNKWQWLLERPAVAGHMEAHGVAKESMKLYNFRHTFISNWIDSEGDIYTVARICGTSVKMVEKRYGHPDVERVHEKYLAFITRA